MIAHAKFQQDQTTGSGSGALLIERPSYAAPPNVIICLQFLKIRKFVGK